MSINTHGLTMKGLKKASDKTMTLKGIFSPDYLQLNYNVLTGCLWVDPLKDFSRSKAVEYKNPNILLCGKLTTPKTQQQLADIIYTGVAFSPSL